MTLTDQSLPGCLKNNNNKTTKNNQNNNKTNNSEYVLNICDPPLDPLLTTVSWEF